MSKKDKRIEVETAILAKKKGFKSGGKSIVIYHEDNEHPTDGTSGPFGWKKDEINVCSDFMENNGVGDFSNEDYTCYELPTQTTLQTWFREEKGIHVIAVTSMLSSIFGRYVYLILRKGHKTIQQDEPVDNTFTEALELGLQKALELLTDENC